MRVIILTILISIFSVSALAENNGENQSSQTQNPNYCGTTCQRNKELNQVNGIINNVNQSLEQGMAQNNTRDELDATLENIQAQIDEATRQVNRFGKHQWGGLNRKRKKKQKQWKKAKKQLLEVQKLTLEEVKKFEDQVIVAGGSDNINTALEANAASLASINADLEALDKEGIEDSDLSPAELQGLRNAGIQSNNSSQSSSGSSRSGSGGTNPELGQGGATSKSSKALPGASENTASSSNSANRSRGLSSSFDATANPSDENVQVGSNGQVLSFGEANGLNTSFNGDPIGISGANLFGIITKKYKDEDKSKKFIFSE